MIFKSDLANVDCYVAYLIFMPATIKFDNLLTDNNRSNISFLNDVIMDKYVVTMG